MPGKGSISGFAKETVEGKRSLYGNRAMVRMGGYPLSLFLNAPRVPYVP
jgi:hypothetical protein